MDHCLDSIGPIWTIEIWLVNLVLTECTPVACSHPRKVPLVSQSASITTVGASIQKGVKGTAAYGNIRGGPRTVIVWEHYPIFVLIPLLVRHFLKVEIWIKV